MSYSFSRTGVTFTAGESAPDAKEAISGALIVNELGNVGIKGFRVAHNPRSEVKLDLTVEPPVLHLKDAVIESLGGYIDPKTNEFVVHENQAYPNQFEATGDYIGPGSELFIV